MVTAYPTDINGDRIGPLSSFSDLQWSVMAGMKNLRWKKSEDKPKKAIELIVENKETASEPTKHRGFVKKNNQNREK